MAHHAGQVQHGLVVGNTSTAEILRILLADAKAIEKFIAEPVTSLLTLRKI
jgi:hypothetical protein